MEQLVFSGTGPYSAAVDHLTLDDGTLLNSQPNSSVDEGSCAELSIPVNLYVFRLPPPEPVRSS